MCSASAVQGLTAHDFVPLTSKNWGRNAWKSIKRGQRVHPVGVVQNKENMSLKFLLLGMRSETNFPRSPGLSLYVHFCADVFRQI